MKSCPEMRLSQLTRCIARYALGVRPNPSLSLKPTIPQHRQPPRPLLCPSALPGPTAPQSGAAPPNIHLMSPGPALSFGTPKPRRGTGGFTARHSGRLLRVDLEGLINTSAISNPNSQRHYATWFGKLQAPIFRQVGFLLEPSVWH